MKDNLSAIVAIAGLLGMVVSGAMWIQSVASRVNEQERRFDQLRTEQVNKLQDRVESLERTMIGLTYQFQDYAKQHAGEDR